MIFIPHRHTHPSLCSSPDAVVAFLNRLANMQGRDRPSIPRPKVVLRRGLAARHSPKHPAPKIWDDVQQHRTPIVQSRPQPPNQQHQHQHQHQAARCACADDPASFRPGFAH
ncbi:hypothetical protein CCHR01_19664 [Colletotrichum chrysophilum]|uniref:Uncharacterized protein n=1 Tax=Colletotrichum chrysophilum TaxID=1836956 RepID=A0AAD9A051_9PEZI|nr:hypothetical protein CCHR01_19664 [Colletotrichum chrysophilum]